MIGRNYLAAQMPSCNGANICPSLNFTPWRFGNEQARDGKATQPAQALDQHPRWFQRYLAASQPTGVAVGESDLAHYRIIFAAQARADWATADREIDALSDLRLLGTALAMRYLDNRYRASFQELSDWLRLFRDLPQGASIYERATAENPQAGAPVLAPRDGGDDADPDVVPADYAIGRKLDKSTVFLPSHHLDYSASSIIRAIAANLRRGRPSAAMNSLNDPDSKLPAREKAAAYAAAAAGYFYAGDMDGARAAAEAGIAANDDQDAPLAYWIGGLAAWSRQDYRQAAVYFENVTRSRGLAPGDVAAADFWTGRALAAQSSDDKARIWFVRASAYPRTLYGLLAIARLGADAPRPDWRNKSLDDDQRQILIRNQAGARALALIAINQKDLAQTELSPLAHHRDAKMREAVLALAASQNLPALAVEAGGGLTNFGRGHGEGASYPIPHWQPQNGFTTDPALIYALMRQESRFDPSAESPRGALGLMQLMPETARHLISGANRHGGSLLSRLTDPVFNITMGQHYLHRLSREPGIDHNLVLMIAAYNWGSNKLGHWISDATDSQDPLFFIESIPVQETRDFLENVLTGYGIYRLQLGRDLQPLAVLAGGDWPRFEEETAEDESRDTRTASLFTPRER